MRDKALTVLLIFAVSMALTSCGKKEAAAKQEAPKQVVETRKQESKVTAPVSVPSTKATPEPTFAPITEERTLFGFERGYDGFEIPFWAEEKEDNAGKKLTLSQDFASEGKQSIRLEVDYPGKVWSSGIVEMEQYLDLSDYREIAVDIYLPEDAPLGLKAKFVLTVGEDWTYTEMSRSVPVIPGEWTTIKASLEPGTYDWKRAEVTDEWKADIRKIVVRIDSNKRPVYAGSIYIDNVRVGT